MMRLLSWWLILAVLLAGTVGCGSETKKNEQSPAPTKDQAPPKDAPKKKKQAA